LKSFGKYTLLAFSSFRTSAGVPCETIFLFAKIKILSEMVRKSFAEWSDIMHALEESSV
jgi:hypothetical protein